MGILDRMRHKKSVPAPSATEEKPGRTLAEDIPVAADWVANALNSSGYRADYTLESMKELDRFFDQQSGPGGILSRNRGQILFGLGAYVGQTAIRLYGGSSLELPNTAASAEEICGYLQKGQIETIHSTEPDLESVFLELTGCSLREED